MKTIKILLVACIFQFSFGVTAQTNHVFNFVTENQEYTIHVVENDTITVINQYQVGDFHYGPIGLGPWLQNRYNVQFDEEICHWPVIFDDTIDYFLVFYGSMPGVVFKINLVKQYAEVQELTSASLFSIYPNPSTDVLHIQTEILEAINIYDLTGKVVLKAESGIKQLDVSHLKAGTYLVQIGLHSKRLVME